jgi:hypothetical protein
MSEQGAGGPRATAALIHDRSLADRAVTAVTPMRIPLWWAWLRVLFWFAPRFAPWLVRPLGRLQIIHAGRWSIVRRVPSAEHPGGWEPLRPPAMVFETNFDGQWRPYIEAFARVMPLQWRGIWTGTKDFPGPLPASGLLAWIETIDVRPAHYYSVHAQSSLTANASALELEPKLERFLAEVDGLGEDELAWRWQRFVADMQGCL